MAKYGVLGRLLKAVKGLYEKSEARVCVEGCFEVQKGARQGCPISSWLFNVFLDMVAKAQFKGVRLDN